MNAGYKVTDAMWQTYWPAFRAFWLAGGWLFELEDDSGYWRDYVVEVPND
jgi:hypothetical protein